MGGKKRSGERRGGRKRSLWRVENQQEVTPEGLGGQILQLPAFTSSNIVLMLVI